MTAAEDTLNAVIADCEGRGLADSAPALWTDTEGLELTVKQCRDLLAQRQWRPIESAPRDGAEVDLWGPDAAGNVARYPGCSWRERYQQWRTEEGVVILPTHWMPLPEPPT